MTEMLTLVLLHSLSNTSTLLNIFVVSFLLYNWKKTFQLSEGNSEKKEERNAEKKRKETFLKKHAKETVKINEEGNFSIKYRKETLKKRGTKH